MSDQIGTFEIGVDLKLDQLIARAGDTNRLLKDIENALNGIKSSAESAEHAVTGLGAAMVKLHAGLEVLKTGFEWIKAGFEAVKSHIEMLERAFDSIIHETAHWANQLENQANSIGINVEQMQALRAGLEVTGSSAQAGTLIFRRLAQSINSMVGKGSLGPAEAMRQLKVSVIDARGHLKNTADVLDELRAKLVALPAGARATALAMALFGREGGAMLSMFRELTSKGESWEAHLKRLGLIIPKDLIAPAAKLDLQLELLRAQGERTWRIIGAAAAPAFEPLVKKLVEVRAKFIQFLIENKEKIAEWAKVIAERIEAIVDKWKLFTNEMQKVSLFDFEGMMDAWAAGMDLFALSVAGVAKMMDLAYRQYLAMTFRLKSAADTTPAGKLAEGVYEMVKADIAQREAQRKLREEAKAAAGDLDALAEQYKKLAAAPVPKKIPQVVGGVATGRMLPGEETRAKQLDLLREKMQGALQPAGQSAKYVNDETLKLLQTLGLVPKKMAEVKEEAQDGGAVTAVASTKANLAIQKMIESLEQEKAAIVDGTEAKLRLQLEAEGLKEASQVLRDTYVAEALALENLQRVQSRVGEGLKVLVNEGTTQAQRALQMRREEIDLTLQKATLDHDDAAIMAATSAKQALAADERLNTERNTIRQLEMEEAGLRDANSETTRIAVQEAQKLGIVQLDTYDHMLAALRDHLSTDLALRREQLDEIIKIERAKADAAIEAQRRTIEKQRSALVDLKGLLSSTIDDMFEGLILGTKKQSEMWKSMWQSLEKTALKTMKDMVLNKIKELDDPLELNFKTLPDKLSSLFEKLKGFMAGIWKAITSDKEKEEEKQVEGSKQVPAAIEGGMTDSLTGATKVATQIGDVFTENAPDMSWLHGGAGGGAPPAAGAKRAGDVPEQLVASIAKLDGTMTGIGSLLGGTKGGIAGIVTGGAGIFDMFGGGEKKKGGGGLLGDIFTSIFGEKKEGEGGEKKKKRPGGGFFESFFGGGGEKKEGGEAGGGGGAGGGGAGGGMAKAVGAALRGLGHIFTSGMKGLGKIFASVGSHLMVLLKPLGRYIVRGFHVLGGVFKNVTKVLGGLFEKAISWLGSMLSTVWTATVGGLESILGLEEGTLMGILTSINLSTVLQAIANAFLALIAALDTGGYLGTGGRLTRPSGTNLGGPTLSGRLFRLHEGEGVINPTATALLGGKDAIMALNEGRLPSTIMEQLGRGLAPDGKISIPVEATTRGRAAAVVAPVLATSTTRTDDHSVHVHEGAITVQAAEGVDGTKLGRDLMKGIVQVYGR